MTTSLSQHWLVPVDPEPLPFEPPPAPRLLLQKRGEALDSAHALLSTHGTGHSG
jgi:hypothetical protein